MRDDEVLLFLNHDFLAFADEYSQSLMTCSLFASFILMFPFKDKLICQKRNVKQAEIDVIQKHLVRLNENTTVIPC